MLKALQTNQIRGAALDVTYPEPLPRDHALLKCDNVIVTPHVGYNTDVAMQAILQANLDSLTAVLIHGTQMPYEV